MWIVIECSLLPVLCRLQHMQVMLFENFVQCSFCARDMCTALSEPLGGRSYLDVCTNIHLPDIRRHGIQNGMLCWLFRDNLARKGLQPRVSGCQRVCQPCQYPAQHSDVATSDSGVLSNTLQAQLMVVVIPLQHSDVATSTFDGGCGQTFYLGMVSRPTRWLQCMSGARTIVQPHHFQ